MIPQRQGITRKIFLITSALLALSTTVIFASFYFLLPSFYYQYKINNLNHGIQQLLNTVRPLTISQSQDILYKFTHDYNVDLAIRDQQGNMMIIPAVDSQLYKIPSASKSGLSSGTDKNTPPIQVLEKPIVFQSGRFTATFIATMQPIDEASSAILMFMPYMAIFVLLISVGGAFLYAKLIAQPLLKINEVAKRMAKLDFSQTCPAHSDDEIGELSQSLNELSQNLKRTMTELKQANNRLKDDIQREREQETRRREFMATISHELKSPITAVMGQLEGMIHQIGVYKDRDKYLYRSYMVMQNMQQLVKEILEVSKLESCTFIPSKKPVHLTSMIEAVVKRLDFFCQDKQLQLKVQLEPEIIIHADPDLLQKAISNVIHNAMNYSPPQALVEVKLKRLTHVQLSVFNTGTFIPESELDKIFDPFYRLEKSRNRSTGGSGLGLFIVKKILEIHSFPYQLTNEKNGVLFTIDFPANGQSSPC
ncbi:sensor histidine kinase [Thermoactinomyces mirandus]|uniref:histidine kinase n=1 Tax=Thermoactinomyces mirandus TaxID=2756294 RepID=A0A7W2ASM9_9BACL|nr:HAMP domain-containing sensor histidine kinase [Thermoactinomyces mirandus]MBA4602840.1 HAMP domain-containing histidine kinase [Thermoactinomyces mirandus]